MPERFTTKEVLMQYNEAFLNGFSVDCVILGFNEGVLKALVCRFLSNDKWMLPGGFVYVDEDVEEAACRVLKDRTGLDQLYLRQFHLFGATNRVDSNENKQMLANWNLKHDDNHWFLKRFVSMGYYALVEYDEVTIHQNAQIEEVKWFDVENLPPLYGDHAKIIKKAIDTLRAQVGYVPIGLELLPEKFTMPELRMVYESVIGKELDRRNFQRKILSVGVITKLAEKRRNGAHKSPFLYSFDKERYAETLKDVFPSFRDQ